MSLELDNDGPFSPRASQGFRGNPARRHDEAPAWPVLARLPRVDVPGAIPLRAPLPTFAPEPIVGEHPLQDESAAPLMFIDSRHPAQRSSALHGATATQHQDEPTPTLAFKAPPQSSSRRYRIDAGDAAQYVPRPFRAAEAEASLSDALFRVHTALVPHMGRISAAALLLAAGSVYWLANGRQAAIAPPLERLQVGADLTRDVQSPPASPLAPKSAPDLEPAAVPAASASAVSEPHIDAPVIDWAAPPRVAEAPAHIDSPATPSTAAPGSAAPTTTAPTGNTETPDAGPALTPPASAATMPNGSASAALIDPRPTQPAAESDDGITPTPELDVYPTTPHPAFSFVDQTPAPQAPATATAPSAGVQR